MPLPNGDLSLSAIAMGEGLGGEGVPGKPDAGAAGSPVSYSTTRTSRVGQPVAPSGSGERMVDGITLPVPSVARITPL